MNKTTILNGGRIVFLDFTRAIACFMVILVHACEFFYVGDIKNFTSDEIFWANFIDSSIRSCVPIFVMMSSYLLVPIKDDVEVFFKKRFTRVLIPFIIWSIAYATIPALWGALDNEGVKESLLRLTHNFNLSAGHLWYVYMFIGIYLFMPVLSPWLKTVKKRHEKWFLILWFISTFYHYAKYFVGDEWGLLGQCYWNEFHTLWYFSGFIGYVVLAHYIRKYINWSLKKSLAVCVPLFLIGWATTYYSFAALHHTNDLYLYEIGWRFCTPNCALATFALFVLFKNIKCSNAGVLKVTGDISRLSYGMYLSHIFVLNYVYSLLNGAIANIPLKIFAIAIVTYTLTYLLVKVLSFLPKSKYIVG